MVRHKIEPHIIMCATAPPEKGWVIKISTILLRHISNQKVRQTWQTDSILQASDGRQIKTTTVYNNCYWR